MEDAIKDKILDFVKERHAGQKDKAGDRYVNHIFRVYLASIVNELGFKCEVVALLHDILEDTDTTIDELKGLGIDDEIIESIVAITRNEEESYREYIVRVSNNSIAKKVKILDLEDNMNIGRFIKHNLEIPKSLMERYSEALKFLCGFNENYGKGDKQ